MEPPTAKAPKAGRLFQEDLLAEPFWMLVACSLVNLTTWDKAEPVLHWLRRRYVVPRVLAVARLEDLHPVLQPLGLWRRRAITLTRMAQAWVLSPPVTSQDVRSLPGCGKYAADTWAIFMEGRSDVQASDGKLLWYLSQMEKTVAVGPHPRQDILPGHHWPADPEVSDPPHPGA